MSRRPRVGMRWQLNPVGLVDLTDARVTAHSGHLVEVSHYRAAEQAGGGTPGAEREDEISVLATLGLVLVLIAIGILAEMLFGLP